MFYLFFGTILTSKLSFFRWLRVFFTFILVSKFVDTSVNIPSLPPWQLSSVQRILHLLELVRSKMLSNILWGWVNFRVVLYKFFSIYWETPLFYVLRICFGENLVPLVHSVWCQKGVKFWVLVNFARFFYDCTNY